MLVISVRELWLPPSRGPHMHTSIHVHCPMGTNTRGPGGLHVCPEMTVAAYMPSYERDAETASGENREKFRTKESRRKKNCTCNYPSPRHVGKWDSFGQPDLLSFSRWQRFFTRNELISFLRPEKKSSRSAPCLV